MASSGCVLAKQGFGSAGFAAPCDNPCDGAVMAIAARTQNAPANFKNGCTISFPRCAIDIAVEWTLDLARATIVPSHAMWACYRGLSLLQATGVRAARNSIGGTLLMPGRGRSRQVGNGVSASSSPAVRSPQVGKCFETDRSGMAAKYRERTACDVYPSYFGQRPKCVAGPVNPGLIAPQLCAQDERSNRPEIRIVCGFWGVPALSFRTRSGFTAILPFVPLIP